jgi:hypothetical protein
MEILSELLVTNTTGTLPSYSGDTTKFDAEVVSSFANSPWLTGYYNDAGVVQIDNGLDMCCSQLIPIGTSPQIISATTPVTYLRASYFDKDNIYIGYDRGNGVNTSNSSSATGYKITVHPDIGTYYTVSANTTNKIVVDVTELSAERVQLNGTLLEKYYIDWTNGECLSRADNYSVAYRDYIPVSAGEVYYIYAPYKANTVAQCVFYDENKVYNFDGNVTTSDRGTHAISDVLQGTEIIVPDDCAYMRFHIGAENVFMTGTTINDIFVYRKQ